MPESITYKGQVYKYDSNATEEHRNGVILARGYHVKVNVLQKILKGREDFHGKTYQPRPYIYSTELGAMRSALPAKVYDIKGNVVF